MRGERPGCTNRCPVGTEMSAPCRRHAPARVSLMSVTHQWHRRSIRLPGFDYGRAGAYFITICTYRRQMLFGKIRRGRMALSATGRIAHDEWIRSATIRRELAIGAFVIMPDHMHGIVFIDDAFANVGANVGVGAHVDVNAYVDMVGAHGRAPLRTPRRDNIPVNAGIADAHVDVGADVDVDGHGDVGAYVDMVGAHGRAPLRTPRRENARGRTPPPTQRTIGTFVRGYKCAVTTAINVANGTPGLPVWQRNYYERIIRDERALHAITRYTRNNPMVAWRSG
jgi:putative transposase